MKKNLILFGSIPLATSVLKLLINNENINLMGVCCVKLPENKWRHEQKESSVFDFCMDNNIPILSHEEISKTRYDLGISIRYHKILEDDIISSFKEGIVNTHGGLLPKYRGTYNNIHAILNKEKYYGATLHYISAGIDAGDIVDWKKTLINEKETGFDLYQKSEDMCYMLVEKNIESILNGKNQRIKQEQIIKDNNITPHNYKKNDLNHVKYIKYNKLENPYSYDIVRAFDSPYHEPAYTLINGEKVYLRSKY